LLLPITVQLLKFW